MSSPYIDKQRAREIARTLFGDKKRRILPGDLADLHFQQSGIDLFSLPVYPDPLWFCAQTICWTPTQGKHYRPALLARIDDNERRATQVHRTFFEKDGSGLAKIPEAKRLMPSPCPGVAKGAMIRLFNAAETLGIAGSIEEALRQHLKTGLPIWVAITARSIETLILPPVVKRVLVFAGDEMTFEVARAANTLAERLAKGASRRARQ